MLQKTHRYEDEWSRVRVFRAINLEDEVIKETQERRRVYIQSSLTLSSRKFISIGHGWTGPFVESLGWPIDYSSYCHLNK